MPKIVAPIVENDDAVSKSYVDVGLATKVDTLNNLVYLSISDDWNAAYTSVGSTPTRFIHQPGVKTLTSPLILPGHHTYEYYGCVITQGNGEDLPYLATTPTYVNDDDFVDAPLKLYGGTWRGNADNNDPGSGIIIRAYYSVLRDVTVEDVGLHGLVFSAESSDGETFPAGTMVENVWDNCRVYIPNNTTGYAFYVHDWAPAAKVTDGFMNNCIAYGGHTGVYIDRAAGWQINGLHTYSASTYGLVITSPWATKVSDAYIEDYGSDASWRVGMAIFGMGAKGITVTGGHITTDEDSGTTLGIYVQGGAGVNSECSIATNMSFSGSATKQAIAFDVAEGGTILADVSGVVSLGHDTFILEDGDGEVTFVGVRSVNGLANDVTLADVAVSGAYGDLSGTPTLGNSSGLNVGTTAGTVAAGDDSRIVNAVPNTRTVSSGTGLSGGGALSSDQTLSLSAGSIASLLLADTSVQLSGNQTIGGTKTFSSTIAGSITGNAATATVLETSRTIGISGAVTGTATSFNGSGNITIPITALDVSEATAGTLAVARGGTGIASYTANNFIRASGTTTLEQRTPTQVRGDIGAASNLLGVNSYSGNRTLDSDTDLSCYVRITAAGAVTLPNGFPEGWSAVINNATDAATVSLSAAGTLVLPDGADPEVVNRMSVSVIHIGSNVWEAHGALVGLGGSSGPIAISDVTGLQTALDGKAPASSIVTSTTDLILTSAHNGTIVEIGGDSITDHLNVLFDSGLPGGWTVSLNFMGALEGYRLHKGLAPSLDFANYNSMDLGMDTTIGTTSSYESHGINSMVSAYARNDGRVVLTGRLRVLDYPWHISANPTSGGGASNTTHTITFPAGTLPGCVQVIIVRSGGTSVTHTITGWTQIATRDSTGRTSIFARFAPASPGASATVTFSSARTSSWNCYNLIGYAPGASISDVVYAAFTGSQSSDPPNLNPAQGTRNYMFIAAASTRRTDNAFTVQSGFSGLVSGQSAASNTSTDHCRVSSSSAQDTVIQLNPATFGSTGTLNNQHSATIAILGPLVPSPPP